MAVRANEFNGTLRSFTDEVEDILVKNDLRRYQGSEALNPIQAEMNEFQNRMERLRNLPDTTMSIVHRDKTNTLNRIRSIAAGISKAKFNGLGAIETRLSMADVPAWKAALSNVTVAIESVGTKYGKLIANSPDGGQIDDNIASVLRTMESSFHTDPTPAGATRAEGTALQYLANLESALSGRHQKAQRSELDYITEKKKAELLSVCSMIGMNKDKLTANDVEIAYKHKAEAERLIAAMRADSMSYNRAIRNHKLDLIDTHISVLRKLQDKAAYSANLSGGGYMTNRRPSTKTFGFGNLPKRRYHEHQTTTPSSIRGVDRPFVDAPVRSVRGFAGLGAASNTQLKPTPRGSSGEISVSQGDLIDILNDNVMTVQAQGYATPGDAAVLRDQASGITVEAFGGDAQLFNASKGTYANTISFLEKEYINKAKRGLIASMSPAEAAALESGGSKIPDGWHEPLGFFSRAGITAGIGAVVLIPTFLYIGFKLAEREARTVDVGKEANVQLVRPKSWLKKKSSSASQKGGTGSGLLSGLRKKSAAAFGGV